MISPKISIIVPVYNDEKYVGRCINSILAQTFTDFELLLIDDGSKDTSGKICDEYANRDRRIKVFHKENGGVSTARNAGIKNSNGEWIIFLDSDDYFLPEALSTLLGVVTKYDCFVGTGNYWLQRGLDKFEICFRRTGVVKDNFRSWFFMTCFPRTGNTLIHSSLLKNEMFNEDLSLYEDAELFFKIMRTNKVAYTTSFVFVYSLDDLGLSKGSKDINKDFRFSMDFSGKTFWEKMSLAYMLNQSFNAYPQHRDMLKKKYAANQIIIKIEPFVWLLGRIWRKLRRMTGKSHFMRIAERALSE